MVFKRLPSKYRSETLIMVIPQRIPDSYVKATVSGSIEDRLPTISDQILSRSRLERVVNDFDLYKDQRATGLMEDIVRRMGDDIDVKVVGKESFRVAYVSHDPWTAQRVTERLAGLYIEENLRDRENVTDDTNQFLESQLQEAKRRLLEHEQKLEEYRRKYAGQLPSQLPGNLQAIQNSQMQRQAINDSINRARERRLLVERQLADAQTAPVMLPPASTASGDTPVGLSAAEQLESATSRLEALKVRYQADHPDVRSLERAIAELRTKVAEEAKRPPSALTERPTSVADGARQKRIKDLQAELDVLDRQIASGLAEETNLRGTISNYQAKVDVVPTRESELVELTRDYSTLQLSYTDLLTKQQDSKIAANLERRQIGEHFKILDPASLPQRRYNERQRILALAGGPVGGLLIGLAIIGLLEYRDSTFKTEAEVARLLALPVLGLIPAMGSSQTPRRRWFGLRTGVGMIAVLMLDAAFRSSMWRL
jgi:polysaccharide chain length determinant protein (PEP-CTERM system associated)